MAALDTRHHDVTGACALLYTLHSRYDVLEMPSSITRLIDASRAVAAARPMATPRQRSHALRSHPQGLGCRADRFLRNPIRLISGLNNQDGSELINGG